MLTVTAAGVLLGFLVGALAGAVRGDTRFGLAYGLLTAGIGWSAASLIAGNRADGMAGIGDLVLGGSCSGSWWCPPASPVSCSSTAGGSTGPGRPGDDARSTLGRIGPKGAASAPRATTCQAAAAAHLPRRPTTPLHCGNTSFSSRYLVGTVRLVATARGDHRVGGPSVGPSRVSRSTNPARRSIGAGSRSGRCRLIASTTFLTVADSIWQRSQCSRCSATNSASCGPSSPSR